VHIKQTTLAAIVYPKKYTGMTVPVTSLITHEHRSPGYTKKRETCYIQKYRDSVFVLGCGSVVFVPVNIYTLAAGVFQNYSTLAAMTKCCAIVMIFCASVGFCASVLCTLAASVFQN